jgi:large subunit ribosomal protein L18
MRILPKRRRLEKKTNYSKRMKLLEYSKNRIVIRKTNRYILLQYVESKEAQDSVKYSLSSKSLLSYGWEKTGSLKNLTAAYLTGLLFGNKIKKFDKAVLDLGLIRSTMGSRIYSSVKGIIDSGVKLSCDEKMFPSENRIKDKNFDKVKEAITKGDKK